MRAKVPPGTVGRGSLFQSTHWSELVKVRTGDERLRRAALSQVLTQYWEPIYFYLRRKGHDSERAKDLTQGFFHEVVLGRQLVERADRAKGRFRSFLLTALDRYVTSEHRKQTAQKRAPEAEVLRLQDADLDRLPQPAQAATPEDGFNYAWAVTLLDAALAEVERHYGDKSPHWSVFAARVLHPILHDAEPPSLAELCARLGIESERTASNMIISVKRRFAAVLRQHVRRLVESDDEIDDEIGDLIQILSKRGAG